MQLRVDRVESDNESTLGRLYVDGRFQCWTLEDQFRAGPKVKGETRIPAGTYQVRFRQEGGFHAQYLEKYGPEWHRGMLHVTNVPGFDYILLHIGNSHDDTQGCLLLGQGHSMVEGFHYVTGSRPAYEAIYPKVRDALVAGEAVEIEYVDLDPAALPVAPVVTDAVLVSARDPAPTPAATPSTPTAATSATEPSPPVPESGRSGAVAGTAAAAGAAVVAVSAIEVLGADGGSTPTNAGGVEAAPSGGLMEKITDPDNLLKVVLIGLGVVVVICAIYFIVRRVNAAKARQA